MRWVFSSIWLWWFVECMSSVCLYSFCMFCWPFKSLGYSCWEIRTYIGMRRWHGWRCKPLNSTKPLYFDKAVNYIVRSLMEEKFLLIYKCVWTTIAFALQLTMLSEGQMMRVKQFELFREDIRDLMNLTVGKMDNYLIVAWWWKNSEARFGLSWFDTSGTLRLASLNLLLMDQCECGTSKHPCSPKTQPLQNAPPEQWSTSWWFCT